MKRRLLASLITCAFVAGGAGAGSGEPQPAQLLLPAERLPLGAGSPGRPEQPTPVSSLTEVGALPSALPAVRGTSLVPPLDHLAPASIPARAASPGLADGLKPAGGVSEGRSNP